MFMTTLKGNQIMGPIMEIIYILPHDSTSLLKFREIHQSFINYTFENFQPFI